MKTLIVVILVMVSSAASAQADRKFVRKGNGNYNEAHYKEAEVEYRKALEENPSSAKANYNLGNSLYKQNQYDAAAGKYNALIDQHNTERSNSDTDPKDMSRLYYNLGNSLFQSQKYRESIEAYKMSLRNNPADMDAKHNLQLAIKLMNEAEQQQKSGNNQQNKDQEKDQDQKKDQQQQNKDQQQKDNPDADKNQDQSDPGKDEQQQANEQQAQQESKGITVQDAERILDALENLEKQTQKEVGANKESKQMEVEKNW